MEYRRMLIKTILSSFASFAVGIIGFCLTFFIVLFLAPAKDNLGHEVMPVGQVLLASVVAIGLGIWSLYVLLKKYTKLPPFKK